MGEQGPLPFSCQPADEHPRLAKVPEPQGRWGREGVHFCPVLLQQPEGAEGGTQGAGGHSMLLLQALGHASHPQTLHPAQSERSVDVG